MKTSNSVRSGVWSDPVCGWISSLPPAAGSASWRAHQSMKPVVMIESLKSFWFSPSSAICHKQVSYWTNKISFDPNLDKFLCQKQFVTAGNQSIFTKQIIFIKIMNLLHKWIWDDSRTTKQSRLIITNRINETNNIDLGTPRTIGRIRMDNLLKAEPDWMNKSSKKITITKQWKKQLLSTRYFKDAKSE